MQERHNAAHDGPCPPEPARHIRRVKVHVIVTPKAAVLDPQGSAVRDAMQHLGMPEVRSVRIGKYLEIEVDAESDEIEPRLHQLCRDLLSNPVIEDYRLETGSESAVENNAAAAQQS
ncbi:MAG: phosphoribosylformylglycinamidine synthase subunit PurS [Chthoniobacterales bacterium]|nr:phosphoribosylformylglycinamidine synthase subunit PurS [Chthoniobacterales bacterium]